MKFSIITPSFRSSQWLKLCIASVADQNPHEHIVQDAGSDDGTLDWLMQDQRVRAFVEKDKGMYDAVNKGLRRATGDILSYLNCDEQYLPGALLAVQQFFEAHPNIDILFADTVIIAPSGSYLCHRKVQLPLKNHTQVSHLSTFTASMFFRRRVLERDNLFFLETLRDVGDGNWVLRALERRVPMAVLRHFTSAFTETGENMNLKPNAQREWKEQFLAAPLWVQNLRRVFELHHRLRRLFGGIYFQKPFSYSIYTQESPTKRVKFQVEHPTFRWKRPSLTQPTSTSSTVK